MFTFLPKIGLAPSRSQQVRLHQVNKAKLESTSQQLLLRGTFPRQSSDSPVFRPRLDRAFYSFVIVTTDLVNGQLENNNIELSSNSNKTIETPSSQLQHLLSKQIQCSDCFLFFQYIILISWYIDGFMQVYSYGFYIYLLLWVYLQTRSLPRDNQLG